VPELSERFAREAVAQLGLVAEREERFLAACGSTRPRDGKDLLEREISRLAFARRVRERAVVAYVPAQLRERNENLARIRHHAAVRRVAARSGEAHEGAEVGVEDVRFYCHELTKGAPIPATCCKHCEAIAPLAACNDKQA
jgi:hypothetical protein